jgi:polyketide synthase 5
MGSFNASTASSGADSARAMPVAVIGMACRLPGGIDSPEQLWEALLRGDDLVTEIPPDRWNADDYYDPEPGTQGRSVSRWGAFLDDVAGFDHEFFGINEREATALDPQHRLLLETSWEAMEHAGFTPAAVADSLTGVFVGLTHYDYQLLAAESQTMEGPYGFQGNSFSMASGRIAHALRVNGPAVTVDSACSSSLLAVHLACRSLNDGESELAFAGGAFVMLEPRKFAAASAQGMLSASGRCHAFDAAADGFVSGEAGAMVLLKRLPDALRDGDRILAVIRGTAANQDGHTPSIGTPSGEAQSAVYRKALAVADVHPGTVGMVEAHGTGTPVGDPIEYASLAEVYGIDGPCALASVKTNFGHAQSASGVLGLMKAVLALQHDLVPRNLHFNSLPDKIAHIETKLFVPQEHARWAGNGSHPRRAAVSSYGLSGTNVHGVLEQAPELTAPQSISAPTAAPLLFALSSTSADELRRTAGRLAEWVATHDDVALPDLAYTLARRRAHRPVRTAVIASSRLELAEALRGVAEGAAPYDTPYAAALGRDDRGPVWVFSGQGSLWGGMGAELLATEPVFAATVARAEPVIVRECGFSVTDAMSAPQTVTGQDRIQPTLFTMQVALAATMKAHGVRPGAVIGHSVGEVAAAVVAGAISLEDGLLVVCRRSGLMSRIAGAGATASVQLPAQQVLSELSVRGKNDVVVAVVASPASTVIAGAAQTVHELVAAWEERGVMAREVPTDVAFHSPQVDPIVDELAEALAELNPMTPEIPFYSATLYDPREQPVCDARYWAANMRRMVRFAATVRAALEDGHRVFAELAPHPLLTHAVEQTARSLDMPIAALAAMRRGQELPNGLRDFVADLHGAGAAIDFSVPCPTGQLVDAPLPTWDHRQLWFSGDGQDSPARGGCTVSVHPLLGPHLLLQEEPEHHVWRAEVGTDAQPWLADHQIHNVPVLPAAAYCEMALAAAHAVFGEASEARDIRFEQALLLEEQTTLGAVASAETPGQINFTAETNHGGDLVRHAAAELHAVGAGAEHDRPPVRDIPALLAAHPRREAGADIRNRLGEHGIQYGAVFAALSAVHCGEVESEGATGTLLAEVALGAPARSQQAGYSVHPALLDACFQSVAAHPDLQAIGADVLVLPVGIRRLRGYGPARNARYCYARLTSIDTTGIETDIDVLDRNGNVLVVVQGLRFATGTSENGHKDRVLAERLLTVEWQQRQLPELPTTNPGAWLLINCSTPDALATELSDALESLGAQCTSLYWPHRADGPSGSSGFEELRTHLRAGEFAGLVISTGLPSAEPGEQCTVQGRDYVQHLVRITREVLQIPGEQPRLCVVTRTAQTVLAGEQPNLDQGGLRGLIRVIGNEHPHLGATQIDVDEAPDAGQLARQLLCGSDEDETAWRDGQWYTARLHPTPLRPEDRRITDARHERDGMRLQIRTPGDLSSLELIDCDRIPPGPGQIEVAVSASSINFADVLVAFGRYPAFEGKLPKLGADFAGVVTAVGPDVTEHTVGDHVGGLCADGCWRTFLTCDARLAVSLPEGLSDGDAAAVTTAHATAYYGLNDLARISAGDKVLIHSATGGVGQAAIGIARAAGAEIFATAGSEERRQLLRDMGIEHVYDSRSLEFASLIRRDTEGYGVDVVLNSVTGSAQRTSLELLALGGRFVEIGKRDIYADTRLGLFPFRRNLTFYAVDLGLLAHSQPDRFTKLLTTVYRLTADGSLPPPECTHYPLTDAADAIRVMSGAHHTGKLVLDVPRTGHSRAWLPPAQVPVFRQDGAYIVTGGLGGLGLFLAEQMASVTGGTGCGRIVLSSRSQPTLKALETIEWIRATGADVVVLCGDIAEAGMARRLIDAATATGLPVRGVLHAAAVIDDATLINITDDLIERDWAPKVYGAWNLHSALQDQPLDWFCSFSSAAALVGSPGQGAYAAANSWLDAFARWRRAQGLPANTIAWGAWSQIGRATTLAEGSGAAIAPDDGAHAFEALLRHDRVYSGYAQITGTPWLTAFAHRGPFAEAFRATRQTHSAVGKLRSELSGLPLEDWPLRLRRMISDQVNVIVRRSIDPDRPLPECGIDSLGALELSTRIEAETGIRVTFTEITTIRGLAGFLYEKLAPTEAA